MANHTGVIPKEVLRVELYERIRRDHRVDGLSVRALADKHRVHRRTVREALASPVPAPRKAPVRAYVAEVRAELANSLRDVTIPQTHELGEEGEVDFGDFYAWIGGELMKLTMFCLRLSASGRGFHVAFGNQAQESF